MTRHFKLVQKERTQVNFENPKLSATQKLTIHITGEKMEETGTSTLSPWNQKLLALFGRKSDPV